MERGEIASFLRQEGIPFTWQKLLTDAYELSSGRHVVGRRIDGRPQTVQSPDQSPLATIANGLRDNRSSISQWMGVTTLVALVFGLAHRLHWELPDPLEAYRIGIASIASGLIVTSSLYFRLRMPGKSPWSHEFRFMIHWGAVTAIALLFPLCLGFQPQGMVYRLSAAVLLFAAIWLSVVLRLLWYEGYRLVWVHKTDKVPMPNDVTVGQRIRCQ